MEEKLSGRGYSKEITEKKLIDAGSHYWKDYQEFMDDSEDVYNDILTEVFEIGKPLYFQGVQIESTRLVMLFIIFYEHKDGIESVDMFTKYIQLPYKKWDDYIKKKTVRDRYLKLKELDV